MHPMIDPRTYKKKNPRLDFHCPLCGVKRSIVKDFKLSKLNFIQIVILSSVLLLAFFPLLGGAGLIFYPVVFCAFEFWKRVDYRREIPCESCGFDAVWYKKDVPRAKQLVFEFWDAKNSKNNSSSAE